MKSQRLEAFQRESADERRRSDGEGRGKGAGCAGGQRDEFSEACGPGLETRRTKDKEEQSEACESDGESAVLRLAEADRCNGGTLFTGDQLGLRHVARHGVWRIVERELVAQSPGEDTEAEQHKPDSEQMETAAAGNPAGISQVGGVSNQCRDAIDRPMMT